MNVEIKKGGGIEDLVGTNSLDTVKNIDVDDHSLHSTFVAYREFIRLPIDRAYMRRYIQDTEDPVILTPPQINTLLQMTLAYVDRHNHDGNTGIFISRLIQTSYEAGHNDFYLNMRNFEHGIRLLASFLKGNEEKLRITVDGILGIESAKEIKKVHFTVDGDVGQSCFEDIEGCEVDIIGNARDRLGIGAESSTFNIRGDVGDGCGEPSDQRRTKNNSFSINGNAGKRLGKAVENSTFIVTGGVGDDCGAHHSRNWDHYLYTTSSTFDIGGDAGKSCLYGANNSTVNIGGSAGKFCGAGSTAAQLTVNIGKDVGDCLGTHAEDSEFTVGGDTGKACGAFSNGSNYNIGGNAGAECGKSSDGSTFDIAGRYGNDAGMDSNKSTYKTHGQEGLHDMIPLDNTIIVDGVEMERNRSVFERIRRKLR